MLIGAAKSATTSLHGILQGHPSIYMTNPKEPCFFSDPQIRERGLDWYLSLYAGASEDQVVGEGSTTYSRFPYAEHPYTRNPWPEIAELFPDIKFVYMVRDPVDRAYSHYTHHMRRGVTMTFEEAIERNPIYLDCSRYRSQVEQVLNFFSPEQIEIFEFKEFNTERSATTLRILEYLGAKDVSVDGVQLDYQLSKKGSHHLARLIVNGVPGSAVLKNAIPAGARSWMMRIAEHVLKPVLDSRVTPPPMEEGTRERLQDLFQNDIEYVESQLGRDLEHWRAP